MSDEKMIGPIVIEPKTDNMPDPIFFSKACRQLGIPSEAQQVPTIVDGEKTSFIRVRLPVMPERTYEEVLKRAKFLVERELQDLPTEQLPSGRWPDSLDEFADQVPLVVANDNEKGSVYIDFGRSIRAIGVSPSMARTIAILIMESANKLDPDGHYTASHPELLNVARLKIPGQKAEQEGTIELPSVLSELVVVEDEELKNEDFDGDN